MLRRGLSIGHFGVFAENAQEAFVGTFEDVIGHVIVEIGPESLGNEHEARQVPLPIQRLSFGLLAD